MKVIFILSHLTSSLVMLVSKAAPAKVETTIESKDTNKEDHNGNWIAFPVNDWVNCVVHVEDTKVVREHV
jgi:hypothetical protein